ncbi:hypothetical protein [Olleya sp. YS]|uniref:hypothetical protein n=1 Tax=Olleya sp. YS TaxID=3028318 RepID=UPI0024342C95|nr:hypothetical protein [Olleya sp. YS]WGD34045.1 hypothetical protein Ollyesu_09655 [Olleya sp. YS]
MKTLFKTFTVLTLMSLIVVSCSKDDPTTDPGNQGEGELIITPGTVTEDDFESFEGEIGIVLDGRPLARKGYKPTQVTINVNANNGNFSETIPLDEYSYLGQLKIPLEGLSEAAKNELTNGVPVTPEYKDVNGNIIFTESTFTSSFQSNPPTRSANTNNIQETIENQTLTLSDSTTYYIQRMNVDGSPDNGAWRFLDNPSYSHVITANPTDFNANETDRGFAFIPIPNEYNTFAILHKETGRFIQATEITVNTQNYFGTFVAPNLSTRTNFSQIQSASDYDNFKYRFDQLNDGSYSIVSIEWGDNFPLKQIPGFGLSFSNWVVNNAVVFNPQTVYAEPRSWRLVSTSVQWNVTSIGTSFLEPILPPAVTSLTFNSVLNNCGSGTLSQTVGVAQSETQQSTIGFEETLSTTTSNSFDVGVSLDVEFSAQILGTGTTVNAGVNTSYGHSWSSTETTSEWESTQSGETQVITSTRTVIVPSGSASLVYDVIQFYPETRINFAQRFRVEGVDSSSGRVLSGEEIRTLFYVNNFNGVVTTVEPTSIVITLKGVLTLDKIIDSESNVQDVPANCN